MLMPHGMTAHHDGTHLLDQVLHRLDSGSRTRRLRGRHPGGGGGRALIPRPLRGRALRAAAPLLRARAGCRPEVHVLPPRRERRWFRTPNNTVVGAVRLNLEGREPAGLHPGDAARSLRWLAERLGELVNLDTGGRVVRRCELAEDVYQRSLDDAFGDLFIEWERTAPIERVWSPATGTVAVPYEHWRQGDHVREGMLLATGPGIGRGHRRRAFGTADVGATLAAAAGIEMPEVDGRPIGSLLPDEAAAGRRGRIAHGRGSWPKGAPRSASPTGRVGSIRSWTASSARRARAPSAWRRGWSRSEGRRRPGTQGGGRDDGRLVAACRGRRGASDQRRDADPQPPPVA